MIINTENSNIPKCYNFEFFPQDSLPVKKHKKGKKKNKKHDADSLHRKEKNHNQKDTISAKENNDFHGNITDTLQKEVVGVEVPKQKDVKASEIKNCLLYKDTSTFSLYDFSFPSSILISNSNKLSVPYRDTTVKLNTTGVKSFDFPEKFYTRYPSDWMIIVFILSLVIFGWIYAFFRKHIFSIFNASYDEKISFKIKEEKHTITERILFLLNIIFVVNFSMLVYELMVFKGFYLFDQTGVALYGIIVAMLVIIYLFKYLFYHFAGFVFNYLKEATLFLHNIFLFNKILGLILFPIVIIIPFTTDNFARYLLIIGCFIFVISFLFRLFRIFQLSIKINFSGFYLILYLCTLEILPLLLIGKIFHGLINS